MNRVYAMFGSAAFALSAVAAIDVHVSPLGDDSADGSQERPFATRCHYGITVSPWSQDHWRKFLSGERGKTSRAEANVEGAAFKAKYPEFASALDAPMRNTFEFNVYEGEEKSFTRRAPAPTVMRGNVCVPKLPADLSSIPGFEPLPPESAIGPRKPCN